MDEKKIYKYFPINHTEIDASDFMIRLRNEYRPKGLIFLADLGKLMNADYKSIREVLTICIEQGELNEYAPGVYGFKDSDFSLESAQFLLKQRVKNYCLKNNLVI